MISSLGGEVVDFEKAPNAAAVTQPPLFPNFETGSGR